MSGYGRADKMCWDYIGRMVTRYKDDIEAGHLIGIDSLSHTANETSS
jgi:hypothetical protein